MPVKTAAELKVFFDGKSLAKKQEFIDLIDTIDYIRTIAEAAGGGVGIVTSVNTQVGAVVLDTSHISENTNLYYTNARARAAISVSGAGLSYNSATGILALSATTTAIPEGSNLYYTDARARLVLSVTGAGLSYNSSTGVLTSSPLVTSVFGRSGAIVAVSGDYTTTLVPEGTNLYYTNTRARQALSAGTGINYDNTTGVISATGGGGAVDSVFGRTGVVIAVSGDYTTTLVTEGTNLYFTNARARQALSAGTGITYDNTTGVITCSVTDTNLVTSVFGRTGAVVAVSGDYTTTLVTEGTNLYFTNARARLAISAGTGISYDNTTGIITNSAVDTNLVTSVFGRTGAVVAEDGDYTTTLVPEGDNLYWTEDRGLTAAEQYVNGVLGQANGIVPLDGNALIPAGYLPAIAISDVFTVGSQVDMLALTAERGDVAIRTDLNKSFILSTEDPSTLADWKELLSPTAAVSSVFGRTGVVVAATNDYTWAQINKATSSLADIATRSASDLSSGTLPDGRFPATLPAVSGVNLTALNASNLTSGTVSTARLGSGTADNTTFLRGDNTWQVVTGGVTSVFGRTGIVVAATNDYTWAQINKTTSSLADLTTRSAADLTSGILPVARLDLSSPPAIGGTTPATGSFTTVTTTQNAIGATPTTAITLQNTTLATAVTLTEFSPSILWKASAWKSNATAAAQTADFRSYVSTTQGASIITARLTFQSSINGSAFGGTVSISDVGTVTASAFVGGGANLTALNASNLSSGTVNTARLGSGTANSTTFLRGDNTWQTVSGGGTIYTAGAYIDLTSDIISAIADSALSVDNLVARDIDGAFSAYQITIGDPTNGSYTGSTTLHPYGGVTVGQGLDVWGTTVLSSGGVPDYDQMQLEFKASGGGNGFLGFDDDGTITGYNASSANFFIFSERVVMPSIMLRSAGEADKATISLLPGSLSGDSSTLLFRSIRTQSIAVVETATISTAFCNSFGFIQGTEIYGDNVTPVTINFADDQASLKVLDISDDLILDTTSLQPGMIKKLLIRNNAGFGITVTPPSWVWLTTPLTSMLDTEWGLLELLSSGTTDGEVVAKWSHN